MRDKSKKLLVINTDVKRPSASQTEVHNTLGGGGGGMSAFNSSAYLLKELWDSIFEVKVTEEGLSYLFCKLPTALQYGMTSFVEGEDIDLPGIYDGLPIDNQTLYWELDENGKKTVLKAKGGGEGTLAGIEVTGEGNAITDVTPSSDGTKLVFSKGLTFVDKSYLDENFYDKTYVNNSFYTKTYSDENFVKASDFDSLQTSFNDFLNGEDVDTTINKWKELESFLSNMTESDNLATILSNKAETSAVESLSKVVDTKWTKDNVKILNWDTAFGWGDHSKAGYALKTYVDQQDNTLKTYMDATFVGIKGNYTIEGTKNFVGELQVNGCPIVYDAANKYWKFEGDMLVTGGLTTFSSDLAFNPSTIMDGLVLDPSTLGFKTTTDSDGNVIKQLTVIGGTGSGTGGLGEDDVKSIIESYGYLTSSDLPTFDSSDFSVSSTGMVSLLGARVKIVSSTASMNETDVLYVIV